MAKFHNRCGPRAFSVDLGGWRGHPIAMIRALLVGMIGLAGCAPLLAATAAEAPDPAPLAVWLASHRNLESLEATFTQERRLPTLRDPITARGHFWMRANQFRWQLGDPPKSLVIKNANAVTLIDLDAKTTRVVPVDDPRVKPFVLLADPALANMAAFQAQFRLHATRMVDGIYQATLSPVDRRLRSKVPWIILHIDPRNHSLRATEAQAADGSVILTIFDAPKINQPLADALFQVNPQP
jgi:outer membrane lipoprotein-sorting protein